MHIESCAGGWNVGDGTTGKKEVDLFFSGALRFYAFHGYAMLRFLISISVSVFSFLSASSCLLYANGPNDFDNLRDNISYLYLAFVLSIVQYN